MYRRLMIVVDNDPVSRAAVAEGLDLARGLGAEVLFFHVLPNYAVPVTAGDVMPLGLMGAREHDRLVQERASRILAEVAELGKPRKCLPMEPYRMARRRQSPSHRPLCSMTATCSWLVPTGAPRCSD